jgi:hypothetical protein
MTTDADVPHEPAHEITYVVPYVTVNPPAQGTADLMAACRAAAISAPVLRPAGANDTVTGAVPHRSTVNRCGLADADISVDGEDALVDVPLVAPVVLLCPHV